MKTSELKRFIKGVVRECITEVKDNKKPSSNKKEKLPEKKSEEEKSSVIPKGKLAKLNPNIVKSGDKGKMKLPGDKGVKEAGAISEYSEDEEVKLIRALDLITKKLLGMHKGKDAAANENHKVQHRSAKTVRDLENNPKNVRNPTVPSL